MLKWISVLDKLLSLLQGWVARLEHKKAQEARDALDKDPANWFDNHFGGSVHASDKTSKTDQADT